MNGTPRCCASMRPSVDLPAPRRPTSAMRRARSAAEAATVRPSIRSAIADSSDGGTPARRSRMRVSAAFRPLPRGMSSADRHVERVGDVLEDDDRRIALPAFDLREIAFRRAGLFGELAPRDAALGARGAHQCADRGGKGVAASGRGGGFVTWFWLGFGACHGAATCLHYNACTIMQSLPSCKMRPPVEGKGTRFAQSEPFVFLAQSGYPGRREPKPKFRGRAVPEREHSPAAT